MRKTVCIGIIAVLLASLFVPLVVATSYRYGDFVIEDDGSGNVTITEYKTLLQKLFEFLAVEQRDGYVAIMLGDYWGTWSASYAGYTFTLSNGRCTFYDEPKYRMIARLTISYGGQIIYDNSNFGKGVGVNTCAIIPSRNIKVCAGQASASYDRLTGMHLYVYQNVNFVCIPEHTDYYQYTGTYPAYQLKNQLQCSGNDVVYCHYDGSKWTTYQSCTVGCENGECKSPPPTPTPSPTPTSTPSPSPSPEPPVKPQNPFQYLITLLHPIWNYVVGLFNSFYQNVKGLGGEL